MMQPRFELELGEVLYFGYAMNTQPQMIAYDVFLSFLKLDRRGEPTRDSRLAQEISEYLKSRGIKVCPTSLLTEQPDTAHYLRAIDRALDESSVLIVVGTSADNLNSEWVRYEWDRFLNEIFSGNNINREVFSYLDGMRANELPLALQQSQSLSHGPGSLDRLYNLVANSLGIGPDALPVGSDDPEAAPVGEAKWLLGMRDTIASLNRAIPDRSGFMGSPEAFAWFGMIAVLAATAWNSGHLTLGSETALKQLKARQEDLNILPEQWEQALLAYTIPSKKGNILHYLLLTPKEGLFAINYPNFASGWNSDLGRALRTLYPMPEFLRAPTEPDEIAWCDWLCRYWGV